MTALPARTAYVRTTPDATHYLVETETLGLVDLTVRLPAIDDLPATILLAHGEDGAGFAEAQEVARGLTAAGFATVTFGRDVGRPYRRFRPLGDWRLVLSWAAERADLRADRFAVWGHGTDAHDVRRLAARDLDGLRAGVAVDPAPSRRSPHLPSRIPVLTTPVTDLAAAVGFLRARLDD